MSDEKTHANFNLELQDLIVRGEALVDLAADLQRLGMRWEMPPKSYAAFNVSAAALLRRHVDDVVAALDRLDTPLVRLGADPPQEDELLDADE